jgi:hypothetical protein
MADVKTQKTTASVTSFIDAVDDETRRADARAVLELMTDVTGEQPALCGSSIVGFGAYKSASGDWPIVGFSPRKANLVLYIMPGFAEHEALLKKLGKHKTGKSCLYKLADVDVAALRALVERSVAHMRETHG